MRSASSDGVDLRLLERQHRCVRDVADRPGCRQEPGRIRGSRGRGQQRDRLHLVGERTPIALVLPSGQRPAIRRDRFRRAAVVPEHMSEVAADHERERVVLDRLIGLDGPGERLARLVEVARVPVDPPATERRERDHLGVARPLRGLFSTAEADRRLRPRTALRLPLRDPREREGERGVIGVALGDGRALRHPLDDALAATEEERGQRPRDERRGRQPVRRRRHARSRRARAAQASPRDAAPTIHDALAAAASIERGQRRARPAGQPVDLVRGARERLEAGRQRPRRARTPSARRTGGARPRDPSRTPSRSPPGGSPARRRSAGALPAMSGPSSRGAAASAKAR